MKKASLISISILLMFSDNLLAQKITEGHWGKKRFDVAYSVAPTNDGGYILSGLTQSGIDTIGDIVVIKLSAQCDTQWTMVYGGPLLEGGNYVFQTADEGYLVAGHTEDFGAQDCDAFIMKLDKNGTRQWFKYYGGQYDDISEGTIELSTGEFVISGITESYGNPDGSRRRHAYFFKTNASGDLIWQKYYAGKGTEYAYSIANMTNNSGFMAVGYSTSWGNGEKDGWLLHLNENGDTLWTTLYKNQGETRYYQIIPTIDNGFMIAGFTSQTSTCRPQGLLIKLDADGKKVWEKLYGDTSTGIIFRGVTQLPNGNFVCAGVNYKNDALGSAYTLTTDLMGNKLSDDFYGGNNSYATSIAAQGNNGLMIAGASAKYGDPLLDLYYMQIDNTNSGVPNITQLSPRLFPNPVVDRSIIILPASHAYQLVQLDIINTNGQIVNSQKNIMAKDLVIDHSYLAIGSYTFRINCKDGAEYVGRFVIQ